MKKFAIILSLALMLASCNTPIPAEGDPYAGTGDVSSGNTPAPPRFEDMYQLTDTVVAVSTEYHDGNIRVPARFNPASGEITTLCADPLCDHGYMSGCPFELYDSSWMAPAIVDNRVYFLRRNLEGAAGLALDLMCYDIASGRVRTIFTYEELIEMTPEDSNPGLVSYERLLDYIYIAVHEGSGSSSPKIIYLRYDMNTDRHESLDTALTSSDIPRAEYKDSYIYVEFAERGAPLAISVADNTYGRERRVIIDAPDIDSYYGGLLDDGILLYTQLWRDEEGKLDGSARLVAYNMEDGSARTLLDHCSLGGFVPAEGGIYFCRRDEDPPVLGYDLNRESDALNANGGKLWRLDIESGEITLAFSEPMYTFGGFNLSVVGKYIVVNYGNTDYERYEVFSDHYQYVQELGRIVYDAETGEHKIYHEGDKPSDSNTIHRKG